MASDPASASLFDKHGGGATAATFVSGDPAQRRKQLLNLAQPSLKGADGTIWWLVASPAAAASVRAALLSEYFPGRLDPGVMTLRQAADRLNRTARPVLLPLGPAARRSLISEIASKAEHRSSLGPLEELKESPGLVDFLASRFRQLRRDGIAAEQAGDTLRRLDGGRAGNVLANLYRDYLTALDRGGLIDDEGLVVQATARASLGDLSLTRLLVDLPLGVCPIEERLVQAIADQADGRFISCAGPIEDSTENAQLPASLRRRAGWSELLSVVDPEVLIEATPADRPAALKAIQEQLFDDQAESDRPANGVRVIAGSGQQDTARRVARHVKLMLTSGVAPSDLVLAVANLERSAPRYAEALTEYGVPLAVDASPHLATASVTQIVLDLLALVETDWSFDSLTTLIRRNDLPKLGNNDTATGFSSARVATEWFVRELQVPSGQKYLQRQAEQIASRPDADDRLDRLREAARAAVGVFESLANALEALPEEATALGWFDSIETALRRLGHTGLTAAADPADRGAGDAIEEACASLENTARWRDRKPRRLRWRGMLELLRSWSSRLRLPNRDSSEGRVRLLGAMTAAGLPCRHLIVVDAEETAFSSALGDTDDAMLSFYELATTPTESLTFAYAALDASAQPMLPSPYVTEVERLFKADATRVDNEPLLTTVAPERPPASIREWRQRAVYQALSGEAKDLAAYDRSADGKTGGLTTSLAAISARARGETFGIWEGVIEGTAAHAFLAERFGSQHLWSASQLELMATCPFKFFSRQVLRLDEAGELTLGIDHRRRGSLMHDALAECLTKIIDTLPPGKTLRDVPPDELSLRLSNQIDELCNTGKLPFHEAALAAIEARQTSEWAERYAEQQRRFHNDKRWNDLDQPLTPTLLEARFGPAKGEPDAAEDNRSTDQTFEFTLPSGEVLQLIGRIDRIDTARLGDQTLFSVVDYKTSKELKSTRAQMESGKQLQPILYAMAARELFLEDDAIPVAAGYWAVRKKGFVAPSDKELPLMTYDAEGRVLPSDDWQDVVDTVRQRCETLVTDIRGGQFPMINDDEHCGRSCEFSTVCRVGQARSLNKLPPTTEGEAS